MGNTASKASRFKFKYLLCRRKKPTPIVREVLPDLTPPVHNIQSLHSYRQCYITDMVIKCILKEAGCLTPTKMDVEVFTTAEGKDGTALAFENIISLEWKHNDAVKLIDKITLVAKWDDTGSFGAIHLTKAEVEELVAGSSSNNQAEGEFIFQTETEDIALKFELRLRFEAYFIPSEGREFEEYLQELSLKEPMDEGIEKAVTMALKLPDNVPEKLHFLKSCGDFLLTRFGDTNREKDIDNCILVYSSAVRLTQSHPETPDLLSNLGTSFQKRFGCTGVLTDLDESICSYQKAINLTPEGSANVPSWLDSLGNSFASRFDHVGDPADISEAIAHQQRAVNLTPPGHKYMASRLNNLGNSFQSRYEHVGDLSDITEAIASQQKAVNLTPDGHASMPSRLSNLGNSFLYRFEYMGDIADITEAITHQRRAVDLTPEGHVDMPSLLNNLGNSFLSRFERTGDLADIHETIACQQKGVNLSPQGSAHMPGWLNNLGTSFLCRFKRTGDLADISEAISSQQRAINLTPEGHAHMPILLNSLGNSLQSRFERTGDLSDISEAIAQKRRAVNLTPQGHADMPGRLKTLGSSLRCHFEHTADLAYLSEAIGYQQRAVDLTPQGHADLPSRLTNLGNSFASRFEHTRNLADITESIVFQQRAVNLTPKGHSDMPIMLDSLGNSFKSRFTHTQNLVDISEAIASQQRGVILTPQGHTFMPGMLNNLGNSFLSRFKHTGDPVDISKAIESQQSAVDLTPQGHSDMPGRLINLANSFLHRFERSEDLHDIHKAISNFEIAATYSSGPPSIRLEAAIHWAQLSGKYSPSLSLDPYNTAVQLISRVAGLEQTIRKRHTNLLDISNLSGSAAACALRLGRPDLALEWLEQGRCLVWSQLSNLRTPVDALRASDPDLADKVLRVSGALEKAGSRLEIADPMEASMEQKISLQDEATTHIKLAQEWDQLIAKVRSIPEFEDFLRPSSCSNILKHLPDSGHVVVINVHEASCDALALVTGRDEPLHIPLPKFSYTVANNLRTQLNTGLHFSNLRMRGSELDQTDRDIRKGGPVESSGVIKLEDILHQLWFLVVKPILDGLGFSATPLSNLPRIWWCATGPLAFLPIHAAGIYATSATKAGSTLPDFAISSYIPTVRALSERVKGPRAVDEKKTGLFMISQPETPNLSPIPGTTREVRAIKQLLENCHLRVLCLESKAATVEQGIINMENHSCIHFACHASQNTVEPLKSRFMLQDGALELSAIIKKSLVEADLAYLSACQTSTGDEKLSEEAVPLAAGMLAAGYRGVVATMWSISDKHGPRVAEDFYNSLIMHGEKSEKLSALRSDDAARALHYATQKLRQEEPSSLLVWVPYVHFGL